MRSANLRALLATLRAGGVSEYERESRGTRIRLRLGAAPAPAEAPKARQRVQQTVSAEQSALLAELGVTEGQAAEVLAHVQ